MLAFLTPFPSAPCSADSSDNFRTLDFYLQIATSINFVPTRVCVNFVIVSTCQPCVLFLQFMAHLSLYPTSRDAES
jgi:hypothetical protein